MSRRPHPVDPRQPVRRNGPDYHRGRQTGRIAARAQRAGRRSGCGVIATLAVLVPMWLLIIWVLAR